MILFSAKGSSLGYPNYNPTWFFSTGVRLKFNDEFSMNLGVQYVLYSPTHKIVASSMSFGLLL